MNNLNMRRVLKQPTLRMMGGGDLQIPQGPGMDRAGFLERNPNIAAKYATEAAAAPVAAPAPQPSQNTAIPTGPDAVAAAKAISERNIKGMEAESDLLKYKVDAAQRASGVSTSAPAPAPAQPALSSTAPKPNPRQAFVGSGIFGQQQAVTGIPRPPGLRDGGEIHAADGVSPWSLKGIASSIKATVTKTPEQLARDKEMADYRAQREAEKAAAAKPTPAPAPAATPAPQPIAAPRGDQTVLDRRMVGLREGGSVSIDRGHGGRVPGTGHGDKIPAKYEPGEFVVSNDMLNAQPELRGHLRSLRESVLAEKGMTPEQADAKALSGGKGLRANDALNLPKFPDLSLDNVGKQPLPKASLVAENEYQLKRVAELNKGAPAPRAAPGALPPHVNPFAAGAEEAQALKDSVRGAQGRLISNTAGGVGEGFTYGSKNPATPAPTPNMSAAHGNGTYGAPTSSTAAKLAAQTPEEIAHGARMASEAEAAAKAKAITAPATAATPKATGVKGVIQGAKSTAGSVVNGAKSVASGEFLKADVGKMLRGGANLGKSVLKSPFTPVGLSVGAADAAHQGFNTPTEQYRLRAGMDSHGGTAGDLAARGVGVLADFGDAITFGGATRLGNAIAGRGFVPNSAGTEAPAQSVQPAQGGGRYSSAADSQAANPYPYVAAPVQHEAPATVQGADGRQYLPEAVTSADHTRSDQLINSAFANRPRDGSDPERNMNALRNNAASMDIYNQGLAARGAGIQVSKDANGQLRLSNSTAPEKMQYTTPDGTPTSDYTKTNQYAEGMQVREGLLASGAAADQRMQAKEAVELAARDRYREQFIAEAQDARDRAAIPGIGMFGHNKAQRAYENKVQLRQQAAHNAAQVGVQRDQLGLQREQLDATRQHNKDQVAALRDGHQLVYEGRMAPARKAQADQQLIQQVMGHSSVGGDLTKASRALLKAGRGDLAKTLHEQIASEQSVRTAEENLAAGQAKNMREQFKGQFAHLPKEEAEYAEALASQTLDKLNNGEIVGAGKNHDMKQQAILHTKAILGMQQKAKLRNAGMWNWAGGQDSMPTSIDGNAVPEQAGIFGWNGGLRKGHNFQAGDYNYGDQELPADIGDDVTSYLHQYNDAYTKAPKKAK